MIYVVALRTQNNRRKVHKYIYNKENKVIDDKYLKKLVFVHTHLIKYTSFLPYVLRTRN